MVKRIEQVLRAADRFQQRHGALGFPVGVVKKFGDDQADKHAALLAYYAFISLFPLLLVFVTVLGYTLADNPGLQQRLIDTVIARFPGFGPQLQGSIRTIRGSGIGLVIGVFGTLWGRLGITQSAQDAMNAVWNVPRKDRPNWWLRLGRSLGSLLLNLLLLTAFDSHHYEFMAAGTRPRRRGTLFAQLTVGTASRVLMLVVAAVGVLLVPRRSNLGTAAGPGSLVPGSSNPRSTAGAAAWPQRLWRAAPARPGRRLLPRHPA